MQLNIRRPIDYYGNTPTQFFSLKGGATKIISRCVTQMSLLRNNSYSIITEPDACNQMRKYLSMHV